MERGAVGINSEQGIASRFVGVKAGLIGACYNIRLLLNHDIICKPEPNYSKTLEQRLLLNMQSRNDHVK